MEGFAKHAAPLHKSVASRQETRKKLSQAASINLEAHWNEQSEQAFQTLEKKLTSTPVLGYADFTKPFILEVDAGNQGLGALLSQGQEGARRPIAFASRGLRKTERNMQNYSSMKLEFLALKLAVTEKFREYLLGSKFTIYTNNNPLSYLHTAKLAAVEQRWASELASFDFEIEYRPGTVNRNANALSHLPIAQCTSAPLPGIAVPPQVAERHSQILGNVRELTAHIMAVDAVPVRPAPM